MSTEPKLSSYLHAKAIKNEIPISGTFELTSRCNFRCKMCYVHEECNKTDALSAEQWLKLGEDARKAGTLFLLLTGGEPLLRKDFAEIYTELKKMGFMVSLNTNGSLVHNYLDLFANNPPSRVNVSLYGADDEAYESLCGVRLYSQVVENIKKLAEMGIAVKLNTVFTNENKHQVKEILDCATKLGVPVSTTAYAYPQVRLNDEYGENKGRMTPFEAARCTVACEEYRYQGEDFLKRAEKITTLCNGKKCDTVECRAGRAAFWLTSEGIMQACGMLPEIKANVVDLGFNGAWQSVLAQTKEIRMPKECMSCKYADICHSCAAMCFAETGSFNKKPEYVCELAENVYHMTNQRAEEIRGALNENK